MMGLAAFDGRRDPSCWHGVLKLGFLAYFLSRSVLVGFLTGVGLQVAMGQLAGVLGVPKPSGGTVEQFVATLRLIPTRPTSRPWRSR